MILSSRNEDILKDVQMDLIKKTKKDVSCFPILCVDIEKDGSFEHIVNVIRIYYALLVERTISF